MKADELLNLSLDRLDLGIWMSSLSKYLEYAESNLNWRKNVELQSLARSVDVKEEASAQHLFQLENSLTKDYEYVIPQAVRYAGLSMLMTNIEWFTKFCDKYAEEKNWGLLPSPKKQKTLNKLKWLRERGSTPFHHPFDDVIKNLNEIRNCIVHDAGIVSSNAQRDAVLALPGFSISQYLYLDKLIAIQEGVLERLVHDAEEWMNCLLDYLEIGERIPTELIIESK